MSGEPPHGLGGWPTSPEQLMREQVELARASPPRWTPADPILLIGGCYICFRKGYSGRGEPGEAAWSGAALARNHRVVATAVATGTAGAAYEPGLLALREGPLLSDAVEALPQRPDVLLVNATGRDHPRRAGLALHLGAALGIPTVGVTHRALLATGEGPGRAKGESSPLVLEGEVVGCWLVTRSGAGPVAVHAGWRTDVDVAVRVVLAATRRARTPEPLRRARRRARLARAGLSPHSP